MSEPIHAFDAPLDPTAPDDVASVLTALQELAQRSRHPVVRVCLEQAYDDIVHLTSSDDASLDDDDASDMTD